MTASVIALSPDVSGVLFLPFMQALRRELADARREQQELLIQAAELTGRSNIALFCMHMCHPHAQQPLLLYP